AKDTPIYYEGERPMTKVTDRNSEEILAHFGVRDKKGRRKGIWRVYTRDAEKSLSLVATKTYENDVQQGVEEHYDAQGNVILRVQYKNGAPVNPVQELLGNYDGNKQEILPAPQ